MHPVDIVERETRRRDLPPFRSGDTVRVHVKVSEGDKERTQIFEGVVIRRRRGGASATFTVRKVSYGIGVERIFPVESPAVQKVEIKSRGHVRRSRLYYLRDLRGKRARLRSKLRDLSALISEEEAEGPLDEAGETGVVAAEDAAPAEEAAAAEISEPVEATEATEEPEKG
jgi:large subunit ribosomal protein L19